jgi:hypothetical protein
MISNIITNPSPVSISEFKNMKDTMPVISSCLTYLYSLILEGFGTYQHQNKEYMIFIQQMLNNMKRPFETILEEMLSAIWAGFYVGEKEIIIKDMAYKIVDIQPRPQQSIIFAVDSQGQLLEDGIIQYFFNSTFAGYGNIMSYNTTMYNGQPRSNPYVLLQCYLLEQYLFHVLNVYILHLKVGIVQISHTESVNCSLLMIGI